MATWGIFFWCLIGDHVSSGDQFLPMAEFANNGSVSSSASPFEPTTEVNPYKPIDLPPLPSSACPSVEAKAFFGHTC